MQKEQRFQAPIEKEGGRAFLPIPFDPKAA
jgi:hypothetical protein